MCLNVHAGCLNEHLALAQVAAQDTNFSGRAKGASQQTVGMQLLDPLAIQHIRLAAGDVLNVARIDQLYFEAPTLEQFEQRDPVNAGRFHRHGSDATLF
jgi:hypothetical protein